MRRAFLFGLLSLALAACANGPPQAQRLSGTWDWQFETSRFVGDDGAGPYWLTADEGVWNELIAPFPQIGRGPWGRARLVIEGELSAPGSYGHLGAYERELRVTRVIEVTPLPADR